MGDSGGSSVPELLAKLAEKLETGEMTVAELAEGTDFTCYERPTHLAERARNPPSTEGLNPDEHVWLEWDEFITKDPEFPTYHAIEDGCGAQNATPCVLTTERRARDALFLAEQCPFCFGNGTVHRVEDDANI